MRRENRPYYIRRLMELYAAAYTRRIIEPQFDRIGEGLSVMGPWNLELNGGGIEAGRYIHINPTKARPIVLSTWKDDRYAGRIEIGDYVLISPGVRVSAATSIRIGKNSMLATGVYLTDSDWHDLYDRTLAVGGAGPIVLEENVWIGDSAIVCKGVTIGENSIIGAHSVVTRDIPPNVIAAGNPAAIIKELDPNRPLKKREAIFAQPDQLKREIDYIYWTQLKGNSLLDWLRAKIAPRKDQ